MFLDSREGHLQPDLRGVLLKTMLQEISGFCDTEKPYHQVCVCGCGYVCMCVREGVYLL